MVPPLTEAEVKEQEQLVKELRVQLDRDINAARDLEPSRAVSLAITKLEEGRMWLGKRFEELGRELPVEYQDKAGN